MGEDAHAPSFIKNNLNLEEYMKRTMMRQLLTAFLMVAFSLQCAAQNLTYNVYKRDGESYYFGKVLVPQSGKYKMKRNPTANVTVELYYGHIDIKWNKIYMMNMVVTEGYYYIDATNCTHAFVVRTNTPDDVVLEPATAADEEVIVANDSFWFNSAFGVQNKLRFNSAVVTNSVLRENASYKTKKIYVMANPVKRGLAFAWLDQFGTTRNLPANSLYILGKQTSSSPELEVVWPDDEFETSTAIKTVNKNETINDAVYSLQGQRVTNMVKGHIYIRNGRKFVAQ